MNFKKMLKTLSKNFLILIIGAIVGLIISLTYVLKWWLPTEGVKVGLGIIGLIPVMLIIFSLLGIILGAPTALIIYYLVKFLRKK